MLQRQCPFKRRKRPCSTEKQYSDPTLACVSCVNSWGSSLPRENILACKCKNSVHSHLGVCEDSLDGVSQLKFSWKEGSHATGTLLYLTSGSALTHNEIHFSVDNSENSHHIFVAQMTDGLDLISRGETSVVCAGNEQICCIEMFANRFSVK